MNWCLCGALVFLEGLSGGVVLRRSSELVRPRWFRAAGVTAVSTLAGLVLSLAPILLGLRNEREGTDLEARLEVLASAVS